MENSYKKLWDTLKIVVDNVDCDVDVFCIMESLEDMEFRKTMSCEPVEYESVVMGVHNACMGRFEDEEVEKEDKIMNKRGKIS